MDILGHLNYELIQTLKTHQSDLKLQPKTNELFGYAIIKM